MSFDPWGRQLDVLRHFVKLLWADRAFVLRLGRRLTMSGLEADERQQYYDREFTCVSTGVRTRPSTAG